MSHCVNYGMVYGYHSHYCGGIIGQWTGSGGNIEECRNYGALQTTYSTAWVGASAGIVAQLYHAYEDNFYNIISCGNFGSVYGRQGTTKLQVGNDKKYCAANDSAGILGNVTTYNRSASQAQKFTIQVLDCVNGSGVEIYSDSMASGIVGFFSTDNPDHGYVTDSTGKIQLRIERCRNFAAKLVGVQYAGGIFGDRYGEEGAKNTIIKDCYSVNANGNSPENFPIVSLIKSGGGEYTESKPDSVVSEYNYFFDDLNYASSYQISFSLAKEEISAGQSSGEINRNAYSITDTLKRVHSDRVYIIHNQTDENDLVVYLTDDAKKGDISAANCYINSGNGCIYRKNNNGNDTKIAKILFELSQNADDHACTADLVSSGNKFYTYVREGWRVQEGRIINADGTRQNKLTAPYSATAQIENGKIQIEVTPDKNPDLWAEESLCDPFKYEVEITSGESTISTEYIYSENGIVSIPEGIKGVIKVRVRAVSMYEDVAPSDYVKVTDIAEQTILPTPDIRAEIVWDTDSNDYRYLISLNNLEEYNELAGDEWLVTVKVSGQTITLSKDSPTAKVVGDKNTQQIIAQAEPKEGTITFSKSAQATVAAFLPASYRPDTPIESWNGNNQPEADPKIIVEGTTLEDLSITVSLTQQGGTVNTPPIYRADLVGTWKKGTEDSKEDVVFASEDILIAPKGTASVTFSNLPEYIRDASDFYIRIWFAQTGLGPVYTYHKLDTEFGANHIQMTEIDESGEPIYEYMHSEGLEKRRQSGTDHYFRKYSYITQPPLFTWLNAPKLSGVTDGKGEALVPYYDDDGNLQYTFYWDEGEAFDQDAQYKFTLLGIDEKENSILIDTSSYEVKRETYNGKDAWALTVMAEEWNFKEVQLSVTRIGTVTGTGDAAMHEIGLTSEASYAVRQRLPKPEQPNIDIVNVDELYYTVTWPAIVPETGCSAYQLYVQVYNEDGKTYESPLKLGDSVKAVQASEYSQEVNLEKYAGKQLRFYLIAEADLNLSEYVDSVPGITSDLTVPERIPAPEVTWDMSWLYNRDYPLSIADFFAGTVQSGLTVKVTANNKESIPPGGSAYLMRAYVYESEEAATTAIEKANQAAAVGDSAELTEQTGYLTGYLAVEDVISPVEMEKAASDLDYQHTMQGLAADYAGKWIVFQARISSGSGMVSSHWVTSETPKRLPFVKLDSAELQSDSVTNILEAETSENPDLPPNKVDWSAEQTIFNWDSGEYADTCYVDITEAGRDGKDDILHQFRIHTATEEDGSVSVIVSEWGPDGTGSNTWNEVSRTLPEKGTMTDEEYKTLLNQQFTYPLTGYMRKIENLDGTTTEKLTGGYQHTVESSYTHDNVTSYYKLSMYAILQAELQEDGTFRFTLTLPDTTFVKDEDGFTLPDIAEKYSKQVAVRMDVIENEEPAEADKSPAYVGSDSSIVDLN